ncbi:MAG: 7-cyano-7-deazaguanine synthase QueC [Nitrospirae bacterium]|nr:7-cyano-7-deazaguanine synthase QueC [Nitrospirota bacterium]
MNKTSQEHAGEKGREKAVILLSGGLDSTTTLAIARDEGYGLYTMTFDYGQRHKLEIEAARHISTHFGVIKHLVISFDMREIGGSALLTTGMDVPKGRIGTGMEALQDNADTTGIPVTYVPARNTIFLAFALSWAETLMAPDIFMGVNAIDYSGYPDCRPEYISAFETMANLATKVTVEGTLRFKIHTPLIRMTKAEIIGKGFSLGVDYSMTWSCYDPTPDGRPCGLCDSCILRARGFAGAIKQGHYKARDI